MKIKKVLVIISSCLFIIACSSESNQEAAKKTDDGALKKDSLDQYSHPAEPDKCMVLMMELLKSSSVAKRVPHDFSFLIDDSTENAYIVKIYNRNEDNDVAIAWLEFDYKKVQLRDITFDLDNPLLLTFDSSQFKKVQQCLGKNDGLEN